MAIVVPEYSAKELPLHQTFKSFPAGPAGDRQVAFFRQVYGEIPAMSAELDKNNVVPVFLGTGYPVAFCSNRPLNSLTEIKGQKWRSASFWHHDFLRNAGANPVSMPWGEPVFKAMRDKTMDGLMVHVGSGYMLKVHEVAPHVVLSKDLWLAHLYVLAMNRATWNGLAPEDQLAIQRAAETAYKTLGQVMDRSFDAQVDDLKKAGVNLRLLDPKELAAWNTTTNYQAVQATRAKDQENKGVKDAVQVLQQLDTLVRAATK